MLSIIVPVYNEGGNVEKLADLIHRNLQDDYELIFVDDASNDDTSQKIKYISKSYHNIKHLRREAKLGLSSAVIYGLCAAKGDIICVMDGDLQHDPKYLPEMLANMKGDDLIIGSRFVKHLNNVQRIDSKIGTFLCRHALHLNVCDPLSGFFMLRKDTFVKLVRKINPIGYKILLELLFHGDFENITEVPIKFHHRNNGGSKLDFKTRLEFVIQFGSLFFSKLLPASHH